MSDDELDVLSAKVFAIGMIVEMPLSDTLKATGNPEVAGRDLVEGVLRLEEAVRQDFGGDHPFILKVSDALTSLVDRAIAFAAKAG